MSDPAEAPGVDESIDLATGLPADIARGLRELNLGLDPADVVESDDDGAGDDALSELALPEIQKLESDVRKMGRKLAEYVEQEKENTARIGIMSDHLKNVEQELHHTQALLDTKKQEAATEKHLQHMAEREVAQYEADNKKAARMVDKLEEEVKILQGQQFEANEKLEKFRMQMNWNQEELLQWSLAAKQKEEDRVALERYKHLDDKRIKALLLQKEKTTKTMNSKKKALEDEVTETQAVQIELETTAEEYHAQHLSRQALIKQWNDAVKAMQRRDEEIKQAKERVAVAQKRLRTEVAKLKRQQAFLKSEELNNTQLQTAIESVKREVERERDELQDAQKQLAEAQDQLGTIRNEMFQAKGEVNKALEINEKLRAEGVEKRKQSEIIKAKLEEKKEEYKEFVAKTKDMAARAKHFELLQKQNTEQLEERRLELESIKNLVFKERKALHKTKLDRGVLETEISGRNSTQRILQAKINKLDQGAIKQQQMLYSIQFQVQQMERKVTRASGKRSYEETEALKKVIQELTEQLELQKKREKGMQDQVKILTTELKSAEREAERLAAAQSEAKEKLHSKSLEIQSYERERDSTVAQARTLTRQHDVLKLETTRLREVMATVSARVLAMRNQRLQLEASITERRKEVALHNEIQRGELKAAEEARHGYAVDAKERMIKAQRLKQKYDTIHGKLQKTDDPEEKTQAYYIIKVAQEKDELQRRGDKLNQEIKAAEKDIRMLTRTLMKLNKRNAKTKAMLIKADIGGPEFELKEKLEEQNRSLSDALYKKKSYLKDLRAEFEEQRYGLTETINEVARLEQELKADEKEKTLLKSQLTQQEAQSQKAAANLSAVEQQLDKAFGASKSVREYVDYMDMKQKNRMVLDILANLSEEIPEFGREGVQNTVAQALSAVGVPFPSRPASRSSRAYSRPGSRSLSRPGSSARPGSRMGTKLPMVNLGGGGFPSGRSFEQKSGRTGSRAASRGGSRPGTGSRKIKGSGRMM